MFTGDLTVTRVCLPLFAADLEWAYIPYTFCCTVTFQDLHVYESSARAWTDLSAAASGTPPSARYSHGFTSAGGKLYVHGGQERLGG
jgi:hypothetical protein